MLFLMEFEREITEKICKSELWFLSMKFCLIEPYKCVRCISDGFEVIEENSFREIIRKNKQTRRMVFVHLL